MNIVAEEHWSIVENKRVTGGRVLQRHVVYLGELNATQEASWRKSVDLLGSDFSLAELHRLYECHDKLLDHKEDLFKHLKERWGALFGAKYGMINNAFGDSICFMFSSGLTSLFNNFLCGYGPISGFNMKPDLVNGLVPEWRGHYIDGTGFYYMGSRYYEPNSGRFQTDNLFMHLPMRIIKLSTMQAKLMDR